LTQSEGETQQLTAKKKVVPHVCDLRYYMPLFSEQKQCILHRLNCVNTAICGFHFVQPNTYLLE